MIAAPFSQSTRNHKFIWDYKVKDAFGLLKQVFTLAPILLYANLSKSLYLEA